MCTLTPSNMKHTHKHIPPMSKRRSTHSPILNYIALAQLDRKCAWLPQTKINLSLIYSILHMLHIIWWVYMPCLQERDVLCHTSSSNLLSAPLQHALYIPAQGQDHMPIFSLAFPSPRTLPRANTAMVCAASRVLTAQLHPTLLFSEQVHIEPEPQTIHHAH